MVLFRLNLTKCCTRIDEMINNNNGETRCVYRVVNNDIYIGSPLKFVITL